MYIDERSQGILHKLGFVHEGTLRQRYFFRDRFLDEYHFGLLNDEWRALSPASLFQEQTFQTLE